VVALLIEDGTYALAKVQAMHEANAEFVTELLTDNTAAQRIS
jgi:hypothetical protein